MKVYEKLRQAVNANDARQIGEILHTVRFAWGLTEREILAWVQRHGVPADRRADLVEEYEAIAAH